MFKVSMLKSSLCDYSDVCILVNGTITVTGARADGTTSNIQKLCTIHLLFKLNKLYTSR